LSPPRKTSRKRRLAEGVAPLTSRSAWRADGAVAPFGAAWLPELTAWNFALYAHHATAVTLLLYGDDPVTPVAELPLAWRTNRTGRVWHRSVRADDAPGARYYAYKVDGPEGSGNRFDAAKILLDPYAPAVYFPPGFSRDAAMRPGSNAGKAPLGVLPTARVAFEWEDDRAPHHDGDLVVYELHVRHFTMRSNSGVPEGARGTFAGVVAKIPYLVDLGVTAVELMPIFQCDPQEGSHWGYMPLHLFSPHQAYAGVADPLAAFDEFRAMVKALHAAGIEVILDVVYNHTTEVGMGGPTYSLRGIDNGTYYQLDPGTWAYRDDAGTGNVLRCAHPQVRALILDSMRFWTREGHVDGFRFDLASIFTRRDDGTIDLDAPSIISEMSNDPSFANVRLIAEPWDMAAYQLGRSFPGIAWAQWNGRFRDDVRRFVKGDPASVAPLMTRLYGSDDLFPDRPPDAYRPWQSVNFMTCHDGFVLYDLVAYDRKHNEANGDGNSDGPDDNRSWNCGVEGEVQVPSAVQELRIRQAKNFLTLLMLANGTPMFRAGDEFLHTQRGNNNPYNQDNEITWLDWDRLIDHADVHRFVRGLIAFRKANPALARNQFWHDDARWHGVGAAPDLTWSSHTLALCVHGSAVGPTDIYAMMNAYWEPLTFRVQEGPAEEWRRVIDTGLPSPDDLAEGTAAPALSSLDYVVGPRSIVVLTRSRAGGQGGVV
jgi:isoamylase